MEAAIREGVHLREEMREGGFQQESRERVFEGLRE